MHEKVAIKKLNESYVKVITEPSIMMELSDYFTFKVPGYQYTPQYKNRIWSGDIHLLNRLTGSIYAGLTNEIEDFCKSRDYEVEYLYDNSNVEFSLKEAKEFVSTLNIPSKYEIRDYQLKAFVDCVRNQRLTLISPTASGKSLIIYLLCRYYNKETLIVVDTINLVNQMYSDFEDYGFDSKNHCHKLYMGQEKISDKQITISTWQTMVKEIKNYTNTKLLIVDEAHKAKAKSLIEITSKLIDCTNKFGTTGTLNDIESNKLTIQGLFGPINKVATTKELQNKGFVSKLKIKAIVLKYSDEIRKSSRVLDYHSEMDFLVKYEARNRFIRNLALSLEGNTLLLYQYVDKHGKLLYDKLKTEVEKGRNVYYSSGQVEGEEREAIRKTIENESNCIFVASKGTFSTGSNIKNLHNIIFSSPSKDKIGNLQSIGRGLRLHESKEYCTLYDIADDLSWKSHKNYTLLHFAERLKIYACEEFNDYKLYNVKLND